LSTATTIPRKAKHLKPDSTSKDENIEIPENKMSCRDHNFLNTMLKIHESDDKSILWNTTEKEEKSLDSTDLNPIRKI
jgi:hypothetical protein